MLALTDHGDLTTRHTTGVVGDLADLGYNAEWCGLPASVIDAPHHRYRILILAHRATPQPLAFDSEECVGCDREAVQRWDDSPPLSHGGNT